MSRLHAIKNQLLKIASPARKDQHFFVNFSVGGKNLGTKDNNITIIMPLPSDQPSQQISDLRFSEMPSHQGIEAKYQNAYAIFEKTLDRDEEFEITLTFNADLKPVFEKVGGFKISDYAANEDYSIYLASNRFTKGNHQIDAWARELTAKDDALDKILVEIDRIVKKQLRYGDPIEGLYSAEEALMRDKIDCGGYSSLFIAICQATKIPARHVFGFWAGYEKNEMHGWAEVILPDGRLLPIDSSIEQLFSLGRTKKFAALGEMPSDRLIFSYGADYQIEGKKIDILQHPQVFSPNGAESIEINTILSTKTK